MSVAKTDFNIALVGAGFMGRAHSNAYRQVNSFFPDLPYRVKRKVLVGRTASTLQEQAEILGWEESSTDLAAVLRRPDIHAVDVSTANNSHAEIAIKALEAGKIVFCEKPLAITVADARRMADAARKARVPTLIWHNYRRAPAATLAAQLIADGKLGEIRHVRAVYLQDWLLDDACPYLWRMSSEACGSGAHGDLNAHLIDMTRFLTGLEFSEVSAMQTTFIKERRKPEGGGTGTVDVDDAFLFLAKLSNGALASFEATRAAAGRKNYNRIEVNGTRGSIVWNFERMNELEFFSLDDEARSQGFRTIMCMNGAAHAYAGNYWPDGHIIGYEHTFTNALADFLAALHQGKPYRPDFADGVAAQEVLEAALDSARSRQWVTVPHSQIFHGSTVTAAAAVFGGSAGL